MIFIKIIGLILFVLLVTFLQLSFLSKKSKKEKWTYAVFTLIGLAIASLLIIKPDLPGPTQLVEKLYSPLLRAHS